MGMTYAALAKSLGISLKSSATSTSATSSATTSLPASTSTAVPNDSSVPDSYSKQGVRKSARAPSDPGPNQEKGDEEAKQPEDELTSERPTLTDTKVSGNSEVTERNGTPTEAAKSSVSGAVTEDLGSDADAEGISDSDIASSRPSSPNLAIAVDGSTEENTVVPVELESTRRATVSQCTANEVGPDAGSDSKTSTATRAPHREPMTEEQLHHAKVLVLDLLGWGVPPEYLLQRGVSHALLYTVFTDLRLRLPDSIFEDCLKLVSARS